MSIASRPSFKSSGLIARSRNTCCSPALSLILNRSGRPASRCDRRSSVIPTGKKEAVTRAMSTDSSGETSWGIHSPIGGDLPISISSSIKLMWRSAILSLLKTRSLKALV